MNAKQYPNEVTKESPLRPFKRAYGKLSKDDSLIVRDLIMKRGKISALQNFNSMKLGKTGISIARQDLIEATFRAFNIDAWTGETINKTN